MTVLALMVILSIVPVSAQTTLEPNQFAEGQWIFNRTDSMYEPEEYQATLEEGQWRVVVRPISLDLEVKITVALDTTFSDVLAVSGDGYGAFHNVTFTLNETRAVYILVEENSKDGDTFGAFEIGVFDSDHIPDSTASHSVEVPTLVPSIAILTVGFAVVIGFAIYVVRSARDAPEPVIEHSSVVRQDASPASSMEMISIPRRCPHCGLELTFAHLEWVGPLEARCDHCGSTVQAQTSR